MDDAPTTGRGDPDPEDPETKAAVEARRREAALRALAAESSPGGAPAPEPSPPDGPRAGSGSRTGLYVGLGVLVVIALIAVVVLATSGGDDTAADEDTSGAQVEGDPEGTDPSVTDGADEPTTTDGSSSGLDLPAPVGDPPPPLDLDGDASTAAEQILAYRQWALANPADVEPELIAEPGSAAYQRLDNETELLVGGERAVVLVQPRFDVTAQEAGETATFAGIIGWLRYSGYDTETGAVVEERAAGSSNVTGQLVLGPDGWKLTELTIT